MSRDIYQTPPSPLPKLHPPAIPQHSPPSPTYSDFSEDFEDAMGFQNHHEDASNVLQSVLGHLDQVVEHVSRSASPQTCINIAQLRDKNENEAANTIAKNTIEIVNTFNDATAPWDIETFFIAPRPVHQPNPTLSKVGPSNASRAMRGGTWASVAAAPVEGRNSLIKFRPSDGLVRRYVEEDQPKEIGGDLRVLWVQGWNRRRPLAEVTDGVCTGPLLSMVYSEDYGAVCLIFQHAESASQLLEQDAYHRQTTGSPIFGHGCTLVPGLPYAEDDDIRRMGTPLNERRRLTFARSQLFAHGMTEDQFKADIYSIVGEGNVELVWLFNTGNATVVFASTAIARLVRNTFNKKAKSIGPYQNVHVSFSHDPCEKAMNLITQMPSSSNESRSRSDSTRSHANGGSNIVVGLTRRDSKRKKVVDADGWQTVQGRKR